VPSSRLLRAGSRGKRGKTGRAQAPSVVQDSAGPKKCSQ
jgi:hypothetical protein